MQEGIGWPDYRRLHPKSNGRQSQNKSSDESSATSTKPPAKCACSQKSRRNQTIPIYHCSHHAKILGSRRVRYGGGKEEKKPPPRNISSV